MTRGAFLLLLVVLVLPACQHVLSEGRLADRPVSMDLSDLPEGALLLWLGDSISWQPGYTDLVEEHFATRHPGKHFRFENLARRGETAADILDRFHREVTPRSPDALLVMVGMNDAGHLGLQRGLLRSYLTRMAELEVLARRDTRARLVWISPTCVLPGAYRRDQKNRMLEAMTRGLVDMGRERGVAVARIHAPFCEEIGKPGGARLMADEEHPSASGHAVLAGMLLRLIDPESGGDL